MIMFYICFIVRLFSCMCVNFMSFRRLRIEMWNWLNKFFSWFLKFDVEFFFLSKFEISNINQRMYFVHTSLFATYYYSFRVLQRTNQIINKFQLQSISIVARYRDICFKLYFFTNAKKCMSKFRFKFNWTKMSHKSVEHKNFFSWKWQNFKQIRFYRRRRQSSHVKYKLFMTCRN